ncbi:AAA family ATPase [Streptosporangium sp. NPDC049644]|uniref:nSTAND1 domain-containing NTPase n=1 Tax=Streptosporangium sp. NPDC049644 TaxID=3155507 RepID=UPI00341CE766
MAQPDPDAGESGESRYAGDHVEFHDNTFHGPVAGTVAYHDHQHHHPASPQVEQLWTGSPYRGLAPFGEADAEVFYGREQVTAQLARMLATRLDGLGMLVVTGPSGAGKSSLLRAGLLPYLAGGLLAEAPGSAHWPRLVMTPTADPLTELALQLSALTGADPPAVRQSLASHPDQAHLIFRQAVLARTDSPTGAEVRQARLLVVVDQFEEIFTLPATDTGTATATSVDGPENRWEIDAGAARAFVTALRSAAETPVGPARQPAALVLVGVRGDFWDRCASFPPLVDALRAGPFTLAPMSDSELRRAITGPAGRAGLRLEDGLAELVLGDLRTLTAPGRGAGTAVPVEGPGAGALPLLSQAMLLTWQRRTGDRLTLSGYGAAGGIAHAVQTGAEAAYQRLTGTQQVLARQLCRQLAVVTGDGQVARHRATRGELYAGRLAAEIGDLDAVLEVLTGQRLLVIDGDSVELAHDLLLTAWPRLSGWLRADRDDQILYGQLREDAGDWERNGRDPSFLYRGSRLAALRQIRDRRQAGPPRHPPLTAVAVEFLAAADRAAVHAEQVAIRRRRLARLAVGALALMALVASAAAVVAVNAADTAVRAQTRAEGQRREVVSRLLWAHSDRIGDDDPTLSGLLSATAWHFAHTDEARHGMIATLATGIRAILNSHTGSVVKLGFGPDGTTLVTGNEDGTVRLWDTVTRKQVGDPLKGHAHPVSAMTFGPDGTLVTADRQGAVWRWDLRTHRPVGDPFKAPVGRPGAVALNRDGTILAFALGGTPRTIRLWNTTTGKQIGDLTGYDDTTRMMAFSPDGATLATSGAFDGKVWLWDTATRRQVALLLGHTSIVVAMTFSPDGTALATGGGDNTARLWNVSTRKQIGDPLRLEGQSGLASAVAFSPDGGILATGSSRNNVQLWSTATHRSIGDPLRGHTDYLRAVAFGSDGTTLATGGDDGTTRVWDITAHRPIDDPLGGHTAPVRAVAFSPDGGMLATGGDDHTIRLWNTSTRKPIGDPLVGHTGLLRAVTFSPDGGMLATGGDDHTVRLWDTATGKQLGDPLESHTGSVGVMAFSPDGAVLTTGDGDTVRRWNTSTRKPIGDPLDIPDGYGSVLALNRDGTMLAIANRQTFQLWNTATRQATSEPIHGFHTNIETLTFSRNGRILATGSQDRTVRLWDTTTRQAIGDPLEGHTDGIGSMAFSPDGTVLATGSEDHTVRLWDTATRRQIGAPLSGHSEYVGAVAFSPDGTVLATGGNDRIVRLWKVGLPAEPSPALCAITGRSLTEAEWRHYLPSGEPFRDICPRRTR